jgi:hypothetical protein
VATIDGGRFAAAPRIAGTNAAQVVLAANGRGATVGWTSSYRARPGTSGSSVRRALPRGLTVRPLDAHGLPTGAPQTVAADVAAKTRLAGAPDGRLVAAWLRPQKIRPYPGEDRGDAPPLSAYIRPRAFTRQLFPRASPARPLGAPDEVAAGLPSVAFDGADHAVAVLRTSVPLMGPAFEVRSAESTGGGPWSATRPLASLGFSLFDPVVAAPASGGTVVVFTAVVVAAGKPVWTIDASDGTGTQVLGVTDAGDGRGVAVAREGSAVLVAWQAAGGVQVAQRG